MTLSAEAVERFGRQILVPEIGVDGQTALLRARIRIRGETGPCAIASDLLRRTGVGLADAAGMADLVLALGPPPDLRRLSRPAILVFVTGDSLCAVVLDRAPCPACVDQRPFRRAAPAAPGALDHVLAAVGATAVVSTLLHPPPRSVHTTLDLRTGAVASGALPVAPCLSCDTIA